MPFFPLGLTTGGPYQPLSGNLNALSAMAGSGYARRTGVGDAWTLDSVVPSSRGGTGQTTYASGDLIYGNGGGTLSKLAEPGLPGYVLSAVGGIPAWTQLSTLTATTITGTANQVLVNGTSGSGQTGPITLTLPQNIDTAATPQFAGNLYGSGTALTGLFGQTHPAQFITAGVIGSGYFAFNSTSSAQSGIGFLRSASNALGTHSAVSSGFRLGGVFWGGSDGAAYQQSAQIRAEVAGTVSSGIVPGQLSFLTTNAAGSLAEGFRVTVAQVAAGINVAATSALATPDWQGQSGLGNGVYSQASGASCFGGVLAVGAQPRMVLARAGGTFGSLSAVGSGDAATFIVPFYDGSNWANALNIRVESTEAWTGSARGSLAQFQTTLTGTTSTAARITITGAGDTEFFGSIKTAAPSGGSAQPWKLGNYTAGAAAQAGKVRVEINGVAYDLLTA